MSGLNYLRRSAHYLLPLIFIIISSTTWVDAAFGACDSINFRTATQLTVGNFPVSVFSGDFNSDGITDLLTVKQFDSAALLLGVGDGTFQAPQPISIPGQHGYGSSLVGDANNDGKLDLFIVMTNNLSVYLGMGNGTFGAPMFITNASVVTMGLADFNNDGKNDLVYTDSGRINVLPGIGNGTFGMGTSVNGIGQ
jgi:hypothetical protein